MTSDVITNDNAVDFTDPFEIFLNLEDVKGTGLKSETKANMKAEHESFKESNPVASTFDFLETEEPEIEEYTFDESEFEDEEGNPFFADDEEEIEEDESPEEADQSNEESDDEEEYTPDSAYDVDFDTVITLPDGRDITIEELANGYHSGEQFKEREEAIAAKEALFNQRMENSKDLLNLSMLEADNEINAYNGFDWDRLADEDPVAYAQNKRYLERWQRRKNEIITQQAILEDERNRREAEAFQAKSMACVKVLKHEIPSWSDKLYETLCDFAISRGADPDAVLKQNDPSYFIILNDAYQLHNGRQKAMAKLKNPKAAKSYITTSNSRMPTKNAIKAHAEEMYAKGKMSNAEAFSFLDD